jgi:hypothetical protein
VDRVTIIRRGQDQTGKCNTGHLKEFGLVRFPIDQGLLDGLIVDIITLKLLKR